MHAAAAFCPKHCFGVSAQNTERYSGEHGSEIKQAIAAAVLLVCFEKCSLCASHMSISQMHEYVELKNKGSAYVRWDMS